MPRAKPPQAEKPRPPERRGHPWFFDRRLIAVLTALIVYTAAGFLLAPYLIRHYVPKIAAERLHRQASIGDVRINPFLLTIEAKDFALREADGEPILRFKRLFVDFELESLFRWAWTFAAVRLDGAKIDLVIGKDGRLNLARLSDALASGEPPKEPAPSAGPTPLLVKQAAITGGTVSFTDRSSPTPASTTVQPIELLLTNVSTLPGRRGPYGVTATLPGTGTLGWQGEISLQPLAASGTIRVAGLRIATIWRFFRDRLRLAEPDGALDIALGYRFAYASGKTKFSLDPVRLSLSNLSLTESGAPLPLVELAAIEVPGARFDLGTRELVVPELAIRDGRARATVSKDGSIDWADAFTARRTGPAKTRPAAAPADTPPAAPWKVRVEALKIDQVALRYEDQSRVTPLVGSLGDLHVELGLSASLGGSTTPLAIDRLGVRLQQVRIAERDGPSPLLSFDRVALQDGRIDLGARELVLPQVAVTGGTGWLTRTADGAIRELAAFDRRDRGALREEIQSAGEAAAAQGRPWRLALNQLSLSDFTLKVADRTTVPALAYDLDKVSVVAKDIRSDGQTPIHYEAHLEVKQGGKVEIAGNAAPTGAKAEAQLKLDGVALAPLSPLLAKLSTLTLRSGALSGEAHLAYSASQDHPRLRADGTLDVANLLVNEADSGDRLLEWKALEASGIALGLVPNRLEIKEVRVREPGAKIVVFKDKTLNLAKVLKQPEGAKKATEPLPDSAAQVFPISIDRVSVDQGTADFADLSLVLPFKARIHHVQGSATGISNDPKARAFLKLAGQVNQFGQAKVDGRLLPSDPGRFTDIRVRFRNVAVPSLSPYSATFAGRAIASGKLDLDLEYKIKNSELLGTNKVVLRNFALGEPVKSERAANLPLDLAVALLTDNEGKIDLAVPVRGNVGSPEFSFGHVIGQTIANLIGKIVTAPFRALGAALGGGGKLDSIAFAPGEAELAPPEREKLQTLGQALNKRPQLILSVHPGLAPSADGTAIKDLNLRLALAQELKIALQPGEDPGPVAYDDAKTQRALEKLADKQGGDKAVDRFQAAYEKRTGHAVKRVNPVLAFIGKASEDQAFYKALFAHLLEQAPQPDAQLQALAKRRAAAIVSELTTQDSVDPARIATDSPQQAAAKDGTVPTRLELGARSGP